jgi:signal peptide peptidase SppA
MNTFSEFRRVIRSAPGQILAFQLDGEGAVLAETLKALARGERVREDDVLAAMGGGSVAMPRIASGAKGGKATVVVPLRGIATPYVELQPFAWSTMRLAQTTMPALANDASIDGIVLDVDSPGGFVTGTAEAADAVYAARLKKTVFTLVNTLMASAAYWVGAQGTEIISIPSGTVGSVGCFMAHTDCSKFNEAQGLRVTYIHDGEFKVEGNPDEPLSAEARAYYQSEVSTIGRQFRRAVARGRGVSVEKVETDFGRGRTMMAPAAKRAGLIDRIGMPDQVLGLRAGGASSRAMRLKQLGEPTKDEAEAAARRARLREMSKSSNPEAARRARRLLLSEYR